MIVQSRRDHGATPGGSANGPRYMTIGTLATFRRRRTPALPRSVRPARDAERFSIGKTIYPPTQLPLPIDPSPVVSVTLPDKPRAIELWAREVIGNAEEEFRAPCHSVRAHPDALILQGFREFVASQLGPITSADGAPSPGSVPRLTDAELDDQECVRVE